MPAMSDAEAKYYQSQQAYTAAKFGAPGGYAGTPGYNPQGSNGLLDLLSVIAPAYQAAYPRAPFAGMLDGATQALNVRRYNQAIQAQAQHQADLDQAARMQYGQTYADPLGNPQMDPSQKITLPNGHVLPGGFYGDPSQAPTMLEARGGVNLGNMGTEMAQGKPMDSHGGYLPPQHMIQLIKDNNQNVQAATNYLNRNQGLQTIGQGQGMSMTNPGAVPPQGQPVAGQGGQYTTMPGGTQWDNSNGQPGQIATGLQQQATPVPPLKIPTNVNPAFLPSDIPTQVNDAAKAGLVDADNAARNVLTGNQQTETSRHNKADEKNTAYRDATGRLIYQATAKNQGGYQKFPPSQASQNPYTIPIAQQTYMNNTVKAIDTELQSMGYLNKKTGAINIPRANVTPGLFQTSQADQAKIARANQLMQMRNQVQTQVGLPPPSSAAFGNTSGTKLQQSGSNLGAQYGVKY